MFDKHYLSYIRIDMSTAQRSFVRRSIKEHVFQNDKHYNGSLLSLYIYKKLYTCKHIYILLYFCDIDFPCFVPLSLWEHESFMLSLLFLWSFAILNFLKSRKSYIILSDLCMGSKLLISACGNDFDLVKLSDIFWHLKEGWEGVMQKQSFDAWSLCVWLLECCDCDLDH